MKAAETRKRKKKVQTAQEEPGDDGVSVYCAVCHTPYVDFTEKWIQCASCDGWTHFSCAEILHSDQPPTTFCCELCHEASPP